MQASSSALPSSSEAAGLGAGKDTIYRDRKGRKLEMLNEMTRNEGGGRQEPVKPVWGTGLAQQRERGERRERARADGQGPVARYEISAERDAEKREEMRWDDPMAQHLSKSKGGSAKPKYRGPPAPPNRFNIPPGYRWDGVDRSNGYEKAFFLQQAQARANAQTAHEWATHDM